MALLKALEGVPNDNCKAYLLANINQLSREECLAVISQIEVSSQKKGKKMVSLFDLINDAIALLINTTAGTILQSKLVNYSFDK